MNLGDALLALLDSLRPILDRWPLVVLAIVLVTLLGIPARILVGALAKLLRVPADYTRTEIDPLLRRANPTLPNRLLRNLRDYFRPVLDRPARALGRAIDSLFNTAENAPRWNVEAITGAIVGLVSPLVDQAATHAENGSARLSGQAGSAAGELRGSSNRWAGWRVIGGFLFFIALCLFLYADAALSIASHEKAIGAQVTFLPEWFREITLAYAIASVVVPDFIPTDVATKFEGLALTFPVPLMLLATALIAWGAIAMPWLAWILAVGALAIVLLLVGLVLRALSMALRPLAVLLGGI